MVHKGLVLVNKTKNKVKNFTTICSDSNENKLRFNIITFVL